MSLFDGDHSFIPLLHWVAQTTGSTKIASIELLVRSFRYEDAVFMTEEWPLARWAMPTITSVLYLAMVFILPKIMESRPAMSLKPLLIGWNFFLFVLSLAMLYGMFPGLQQLYIHKGWHDVLCDPDYSRWEGPQFFWIYVFVLSKYAELFDTVLLILRKKPVALLHWWHHFSVLCMTWYLIVVKAQPGWFFAAINCTVHCFMYYYYMRASMGAPPKWGRWLTQGQIAQMVVGIVLTVLWSMRAYENEETCPSLDRKGIVGVSTFVYSTYLVLFYVSRWMKGNDKRKNANGQKKEQ